MDTQGLVYGAEMKCTFRVERSRAVDKVCLPEGSSAMLRKHCGLSGSYVAACVYRSASGVGSLIGAEKIPQLSLFLPMPRWGLWLKKCESKRHSNDQVGVALKKPVFTASCLGLDP